MSNKEAAGKMIEAAFDEDIDRPEESRRAALMGIGYALLDIADAIREQTKTIDTELPDIRIALQEMQRTAEWASEHR